MGRPIIIQPDGKFAVFSTVTDTIVAFDLTKEELLEYEGNYAKQTAIWMLQRSLDSLEKDPPTSRHHFSSKTFEEVLETHVEHEANCDDPEYNAAIRAELRKINPNSPALQETKESDDD